MRRPDFFIVGAPKCGTTAMYRYLQQHPDIFMPVIKEPHYFATDLEASFFVQEEEAYLALFHEADSEKRVGEASTWYLYSEVAPSAIHAFDPAARIIIMLRNPADMMYSLHSHNLYVCEEDIPVFEDALAAETERKHGRRLPPKVDLVQNLYYRDAPRYAKRVRRYLDLFDPSQIHVILYDDFKEQTADVYVEVCRFLGVTTEFRPDFPVIYGNKKITKEKLHGLLMKPPDIVKRASSIVPVGLRKKGLRLLYRLTMRRAPRPEMKDSLREQLQAEFRPEVLELSAMIGRDLSRWLN